MTNPPINRKANPNRQSMGTSRRCSARLPSTERTAIGCGAKLRDAGTSLMKTNANDSDTRQAISSAHRQSTTSAARPGTSRPVSPPIVVPDT